MSTRMYPEGSGGPKFKYNGKKLEALDDNGDVIYSIDPVGRKFGFFGATPVVQPADAAQVAPAAYVTGAFGLDSDAKMQALFDLVVEMRTALVDLGVIKGAA